MSDTCSLFPPFGDPSPSYLLPSHKSPGGHRKPLDEAAPGKPAAMWSRTESMEFFYFHFPKQWRKEASLDECGKYSADDCVFATMGPRKSKRQPIFPNLIPAPCVAVSLTCQNQRKEARLSICALHASAIMILKPIQGHCCGWERGLCQSGDLFTAACQHNRGTRWGSC